MDTPRCDAPRYHADVASRHDEGVFVLFADYLTLQRALLAAERDAARYRWLRDDADNQSDSWAIGVYPADERCIVAGASLDAAIDAALAGKQEEGR